MNRLPLILLLTLSGVSCSTTQNDRKPASFFKDKSCRELLSSIVKKGKKKGYGDEELVTVAGKEIDVTPIKEYIRSSSLNKKLRAGEKLTEKEQELYDRLSDTLKALPTRQGKSFRKISAQPPHNTLDDLLSAYSEGKEVTEQAFTSVALSEDTKVWGDILRADIIMEIDGKSLRDISQINELENEGIFLPGTKFKVKEVIGDYEYNETVEIIEDEMIEDEIEYYSKFMEKYEDYFGLQGVYAEDMNPKFQGLRDMDYGEFKPVEMDNWEDLIKQKIVPIIRIKLEEVTTP